MPRRHPRHARRQPYDGIDPRQVGAGRATAAARTHRCHTSRNAAASRRQSCEGRRSAAACGRRRRDFPRTGAATACGSTPRPVPPDRPARMSVGWRVRPTTGGTPRNVEGVARHQHAAEALGRELAGQEHGLERRWPSHRRTPAPRLIRAVRPGRSRARPGRRRARISGAQISPGFAYGYGAMSTP